MLAVAGACHRTSDVTGVRIVVQFSVPAEQIEFAILRASDAQPILTPTIRPARAQGALRSPSDIVVYLPDSDDGTDVLCTARLLQSGGSSGSSSGQTRIKAREVVTVNLTVSATDGSVDGADDGAVDLITPWDGAPRPQGELCGSNDECGSSYCVDGVCCDSPCSGICQQCNAPGKYGTCTFSAPGTRDTGCPDDGATSCGRDGTCDGNGGCRLFPVGTACLPTTCTYATGDFKMQSSCDGNGVCTPGAIVTCAPYRCNAAGCMNSCTLAGDCVTGTCNNGTCSGVTTKPPGSPCTDGAQCSTGICSDGVCCTSDCSGQACRKCNSLGTCAPVEAGAQDPHGQCVATISNTCGLSGACDGAGACAYWQGNVCSNSGSYCGSTTKSNLWARRCDGAGTCATNVSVADCAPYTCITTGYGYTYSSCTTSCTANSSCASSNARCDTAAQKCVSTNDGGTGG